MTNTKNNKDHLGRMKALSLAIGAASLVETTLVNAEEAELFLLEEIVVTAQKREQNLVDVPISIAAMGERTIEQTGIRELQEIDEYIPNLQISKGSSSGSTITIRGVGSSSRNIGFDSRVGVYVDGVYMGQSPASNQDILDLARVEVLRGPQGTLFGKNTVAGAISLITKKPTEEFSGSLKADFGNMGSQRYSAVLNMPLSEKVLTKLSVNVQERDGYIKNIPTGDDLRAQDGTSYRLQVSAELSDNLEMNFSFDGLDSKRKLASSSSFATDAGLLEPAAAPFTSNFNFVPFEERELRGAALTFDWSLGNGYSIKSISAFRDTYNNSESDLDAGVPYLVLGGMPLNGVFGLDQQTELAFEDEYKQKSQEFQLISPEGKALQYVAGLYLYDQEGNTNRNALSHHDASFPLYALGILPYPGQDSYTLKTSGSLETSSYAAFINGSYTVNERFTIGFGARYSEEKKEVDWTSNPTESASSLVAIPAGVLGPFEIPAGFLTLNSIFGFANETLVDSRTDSHLSPELSFRYAISEEMNAYYRVSSGFKSGGYNVDFITAAQYALGLDFDKETVVSHELGLKGEMFNRRLSFGASIFSANYDDYQVQQFQESTDAVAGAAIIGNASEVDTTGLEIEMTALLTPNLKLTAALGILDAEFVSFDGGGTDVDGNPIDLAGVRLAGAPDKTFNLGMEYYKAVPTLGAEALFRIDYAYSGERYLDTNNQEERTRTLENGDEIDFLYLGDTTRLNARIGLYSSDDTWSFALWGRNLTDENDAANGLNIFGTYQRSETLPRTYGIEFGYRF